jgi:hypothetical protein
VRRDEGGVSASANLSRESARRVRGGRRDARGDSVRGGPSTDASVECVGHVARAIGGGRRGAYLRSDGRNAAAEECVAKL